MILRATEGTLRCSLKCIVEGNGAFLKAEEFDLSASFGGDGNDGPDVAAISDVRQRDFRNSVQGNGTSPSDLAKDNGVLGDAKCGGVAEKPNQRSNTET
jgi:hypothetical protein